MPSFPFSHLIPKPSPLLQIPTTHLSNPSQFHFSISRTPSFLKFQTTHFSKHIKNHVSTQKTTPCLHFPTTHLKNSLHCTLFSVLSIPLPSFASETEQISASKINLESILVSIDDFFNRNPFFVAGLAFIWLVVIPLTQEYLKKYKLISAIDAFRKLREMPECQLLDIRSRKSVVFMDSPNLKMLNKNAVQVEYKEGDEEGFVKQVLKNFEDPGKTVVCVLDNFDGNSLKVAELLFKKGFKEAYAIKGGLRGKDGWQAIQETLLPPSVHVSPRKMKSKSSSQVDASRAEIKKQTSNNGQPPPSPSIHQDISLNVENGSVNPMQTAPRAELPPKRPSSPYPNYPDLKPPSSPTPSKPQT